MATIVTRAGKGSPLTNTEMDSNLTTLSTSIFNGTSNVAVNSSNGAATITTAGTTAVTIDTSQNVGIGATSPLKKLDVYLPTTGTVETYTRNSTINLLTTINGTTSANFGTETSHPLTFLTGNVERTRIDTSGNWLLGTTTQIGTGKVSIFWNGTTANAIELQESSSASGAGFASFRNSSAVQIGSITRVGTTNAVVFNTTSDARLKSNIEDSSAVLDKLLTVKVRKFDWTEGDIHQEYGFIAQELEPILSGIVTKGKTEEDVWQLDYSRLTPHLVKAIQEQQALITQLQADVAALKAK